MVGTDKWMVPGRNTAMSHPELLQHLSVLINECPQPLPLGYNKEHTGGSWEIPHGATFPMWVPDGAYYNGNQVDRFVRFCERFLTFEKGPLENQPIVFDTWQIDMIVRPLFGLYWTFNKHPVHNRAFFLAGRGSAKTLMVSCLCLFTLVARGYAKPEVDLYSLSREQAGFGFDSSARWINDSEALASILDPIFAKKMIRNLQNQGTMMVRTGEADREQGRGATLACIDDMLSQRNRKLLDVVSTGMGKAAGSLLILMTTPDIVPTPTAKSEYDTAVAVANERGSRPEYLPVVFEPDAELADGDIRAWVQASPGLKAGWVGLPSLLAKWRDTETSPGALQSFKALNLCRWGKGGRTAMTLGWDACLAPHGSWITEAVLKRCKLYVGFDASSSRDLTCVVYLLCDDTAQRWYVESRYWCAKHTWDDILDWTDQEASIWLQQGSKVTLVDYNQDDNTVWIDSHSVVKSVEADLKRLGWPQKRVEGMAMDSHRVHDYVRVVKKYTNLHMQLISSTAKSMEPALQRTVQMIGDERMLHRGCQLDRWQVLNANVTRKGQYQAVEQPRDSTNTRRKIDFVSALLAAVDRRLAWERTAPGMGFMVFGDPTVGNQQRDADGLEPF